MNAAFTNKIITPECACMFSMDKIKKLTPERIISYKDFFFFFLMNFVDWGQDSKIGSKTLLRKD